MREAIQITSQQDIQLIIILSDSQVVDNSSNRRIHVRKDIINLVKDVKRLLTLFKNNRT